MKIKDLLSVLECESVYVQHDGFSRELDRADELMVAAYGDFIVEKAIVSHTDGVTMCEISVKTQFCKAG